MSKKLKIKFWRAERALAMQILEQEGLPNCKETGKVKITGNPSYCGDVIYLRGESKRADNYILSFYFEFQYEVENKIKKITQAITDELFTGKGKLEVGEMCEVKISDGCDWATRKLLAILPEEQSYRYICNHSSIKDTFTMCKYARPFAKRTEPKVEECGEIITYTWEEK